MDYDLPVRGDNHVMILRLRSPLQVNLCFSAACVAKAAACSSVCRLSRGSDIHSRITVRRAACSGLIFKTFQTLDNDYRKHNAYLRRSSTAWR